LFPIAKICYSIELNIVIKLMRVVRIVFERVLRFMIACTRKYTSKLNV